MSRNQVVSNYINGNLSDAKAGASRITWRNLYMALTIGNGYSHAESVAIADYLKGHSNFDEHCKVIEILRTCTKARAGA